MRKRSLEIPIYKLEKKEGFPERNDLNAFYDEYI